MFAQDAAETFEFGRFVLDPDRRALLADGEKVALSSRAFDILAVLLAERGRVVGRDELVARVWGGMAVGQNNLAVQMSALRAALSCQPGGDRLILTIPGRGYRFVGDASVRGRVSPPAPAPAPAPAPDRVAGQDEPAAPASKRRPLAWPLVGGALLILACLLGLRALGPRPALQAPRFSIAVLPFRNTSADPGLDHVADAITDDLTTELSHIPGSIVIARDSADMFKGRAVAAQTVGQALNVRYLLDGSLRLDGSMFHVDAHLVDAGTGVQLWAGQIAVEGTPLSEAQKAIVGRIDSALGSQLGQVEAARSLKDRPDDPDAIDLFFRARSILDRDKSPNGFSTAQTYLEQAIHQQPEFGDALATLAWMLVSKIQSFDDPDEAQDFREARTRIAQALRVAPRNATALAAQAYAQASGGDCKAASYSAQAALEIDMSDVNALGVTALCAQIDARLDEAASAFQSLLRLDPQGGSSHSRYLALANIRMLQSRYDDALDLVHKAVAGEPEPGREDSRETMGHAEFARLLLIGILELKGEDQRARTLYGAYESIWPHRSAWRVASYFYKSQMAMPGFARFSDALVAAGMPRFAQEAEDAAAGPAAGGSATDFAPVPKAIEGAETVSPQQVSDRLGQDPALVVIDVGQGQAVIRGASWHGPDYASETETDFAGRVAAQRSHGDFGRQIVVMSDGVYGTGSHDVASHLVSLGYRHVLWLRGGEEAWAAAGLPADNLMR